LQAHDKGFTLADRAAPLVRTLRVQLDETTSFFIRDGWEIETIVTESSEQALRYSVPQGRRLPMHALASGKVLLGALAPDELERYFRETERVRFTPSTVVDEPTLRRQVEEARLTGFAMTDEEFSLGIVGIARLVTIDGEPVGSLSVAVPKVRFTDDLHARVADLLDRTASLLETI
jgi:IclR family acetate operon transcriptional repressor